MKSIFEASFRDVYHKTIYIEADDMAPIAEAVRVMDGADGFLAYGFFEDRAGMSFLVLASAKNEGGSILTGPSVAEEYCRVRYRDVEKLRFIPEEELAVDGGEFAEAREQVAASLEPKEEFRLKLLDHSFMDGSRNPENPEYVSLTLWDGKLAPEMAWVRPVRIGTEGELYGYLAHPPFQSFDISPEAEIMFRAYDNGAGGIQFMWDGRCEDEK